MGISSLKCRVLQWNTYPWQYTNPVYLFWGMQVIEMMQVYLQRSGKSAECDLLGTFSTRIRLHQTRQEVILFPLLAFMAQGGVGYRSDLTG